jgi:hypothetical protein
MEMKPTDVCTAKGGITFLPPDTLLATLLAEYNFHFARSLDFSAPNVHRSSGWYLPVAPFGT